jgi:hypothetical protein
LLFDLNLSSLKICYKPGYRHAFGVKESPDSTEQCTGEEPGFVPIVIGTETESATENDLNPSPSPLVEKGRMEG